MANREYHAEESGRERALSNLLTTFSVESKRHLLEKHHVPFDGTYYAVIRITTYDLPGKGTDLPDDQLLQNRSWIREVSESALQPLCTAYFTSPEFYAMALFLAFPQGSNLQQMLPQVQTALIRAFRRLAAERQIYCYCAMSQPVSSLEAFPLAYQQAADLAISRRNTNTLACYLAGQDIVPGQEKTFAEVLRLLLSMLSTHQYTKIPDYLRQQYLCGSFELADLRCINTLLESYTLKLIGAHSAYPEAFRLLSRLSRHLYFQFDPDAWHADLAALFSLLDQAVFDGRYETVGNAGAGITEYLIEHYSDPELTLNQLASVFHLSTSYISRTFKQYTGLNMIEFLTDLRLNRAKDLLCNTEMSIRDIAVAVGYSPDTFSRVFRRNEQSSPSQYRAASQQTG